MSCALISGITGHLGRELARQLVAAGVEVHGVTRADVTTGEHSIRDVQLHHIDGKTDSLIVALSEIRPDTVFHLASYYRREHGRADVVPLVEANILFGAQLLEAARWVGCRRFIVAGSYFQHFGADECRALNLYAATKQGFENLLAYYVDAFGINAAALTLYEVYSETDVRPKLMTVIADAWAKGTTLELPADEFAIDLVHVEDVAAAFLQTASLFASDGDGDRALVRYSVCSGVDVTPTQLLHLFERLGERKLSVRFGAFPQPTRRMPQPWRGQVVPGWRPRVTLESGIARMLARRR